MNASVPCFRKTPVAKKFLDMRWEFQDFLSKNFCLTLPKISVGGGFFSVSLTSGLEKVLNKGGGTIKIFRRTFFCLTVPKFSVGEAFTVVKISGVEKVRIGGGRVIKIFRRIFFVSRCRKFKHGGIL